MTHEKEIEAIETYLERFIDPFQVYDVPEDKTCFHYYDVFPFELRFDDDDWGHGCDNTKTYFDRLTPALEEEIMRWENAGDPNVMDWLVVPFLKQKTSRHTSRESYLLRPEEYGTPQEAREIVYGLTTLVERLYDVLEQDRADYRISKSLQE